jgi:hypothetical protein
LISLIFYVVVNSKYVATVLFLSSRLYNVQEQWLVTDISVEGVMERGVLPPNLTDNAKVVLPAGRYPVQVMIFSYSQQ